MLRFTADPTSVMPALSPVIPALSPVIPAKAGIQTHAHRHRARDSWTPAFAGVTDTK